MKRHGRTIKTFREGRPLREARTAWDKMSDGQREEFLDETMYSAADNNHTTTLDTENIQAEREQFEAEQRAELQSEQGSCESGDLAFGWSAEEAVMRIKDNAAAVGCIRTHLERVQGKKIEEMSARIARLEALILSTSEGA